MKSASTRVMLLRIRPHAESNFYVIKKILIKKENVSDIIKKCRSTDEAFKKKKKEKNNPAISLFYPDLIYLIGVQPFGHGPSGYDIIHDSFREGFRHFVKFHKFANVVQHIMILSRCRSHLLDDCRHMTENCSVKEGCRIFIRN